MGRILIAALVGAGLGALGTWALGPEEEPRERTSGSRPDEAPRRTEEGRVIRESGTLEECNKALVATRVELRSVQAVAARAVAGQLFDDDGTPLPPSEDTPSREPGSAADDAEEAERQAERRRVREATEKVRDAVIGELGITDDEQQAVADLVCSQRENDRGLYSDYAEGRIDTAALLAGLAQERTTSSEGLQKALGPGRFRAFRRVGAIGMVASRLCKGR